MGNEKGVKMSVGGVVRRIEDALMLDAQPCELTLVGGAAWWVGQRSQQIGVA